MKTTKEVNDIPTWEEIGDAVGMNSDAAWAMNKRIMEKARLLLFNAISRNGRRVTTTNENCVCQ
jgi:hypothetical protein